MGGSVRKEMTVKVTHLVANCTGGDKYKVSSIGIPFFLSHTFTLVSLILGVLFAFNCNLNIKIHVQQCEIPMHFMMKL